jgi:hypothetical protein
MFAREDHLPRGICILRPTFRLRTALIGFAIIGLVLGVLAMQRRRARYREIAAFHARSEAYFTNVAKQCSDLAKVASVVDSVATVPEGEQDEPDDSQPHLSIKTGYLDYQAHQLDIRTSYHSALKSKYERAAAHPWWPVPPDPPEPILERLRLHTAAAEKAYRIGRRRDAVAEYIKAIDLALILTDDKNGCTQAAAILRRALTICEDVSPSDKRDLARSLVGFAASLRAGCSTPEAERLEYDARAMFAKFNTRKPGHQLPSPNKMPSAPDPPTPIPDLPAVPPGLLFDPPQQPSTTSQPGSLARPATPSSTSSVRLGGQNGHELVSLQRLNPSHAICWGAGTRGAASNRRIFTARGGRRGHCPPRGAP